MKVSIIVNCHNGEKYLEECLESIKKQTIADKEVGIFLSSGLDSSLIFSYLIEMKYEIF